MKKIFLVLVNTGFILANAGAALLFQDGFDYTSGQLLSPVANSAGQLNAAYSVNWWDAGPTGAAVNKPPGIASGGLGYNGVAGYSGLQSTTGNSVSFDSTQLGTARIQVTTPAISSGTVYWSGLIKVNNVSSLNSVNGALLGGFNNSVGYQATLPTAVGAVLRIRQDPGNASLFNIGTSVGTATGVAISWSSGQSVGSTIFVAASYQFVAGTLNDVASMWINPNQGDFGNVIAPGGALTITGVTDPFTSLSSFNLRNVNTVGTTWTAQFDELMVGDTWASVMPTAVPEPASAVLLGLGMLIGCYRLRKR